MGGGFVAAGGDFAVEVVAVARGAVMGTGLCETCKYLQRHISSGIHAPVCMGMKLVRQDGSEPRDYDMLIDLKAAFYSPKYREIVTPKLDSCEHHANKGPAACQHAVDD